MQGYSSIPCMEHKVETSAINIYVGNTDNHHAVIIHECTITMHQSKPFMLFSTSDLV